MDDRAPKFLGLRLSAYADSALGRANGEHCTRLLRALDGLKDDQPSTPAKSGRKPSYTYSGAARSGSDWEKRLQLKPPNHRLKYHWS
jgi:hypothetical protein